MHVIKISGARPYKLDSPPWDVELQFVPAAVVCKHKGKSCGNGSSANNPCLAPTCNLAGSLQPIPIQFNHWDLSHLSGKKVSKLILLNENSAQFVNKLSSEEHRTLTKKVLLTVSVDPNDF